MTKALGTRYLRGLAQQENVRLGLADTFGECSSAFSGTVEVNVVGISGWRRELATSRELPASPDSE